MINRVKKIFLIITVASLFIAGTILTGCSTLKVRQISDSNLYPVSIMKPGEPLAIMPFEAESALSNLGSLISDEVTANLIENIPNIKIIPTSVTRNFLQTSNLPINGIPDLHTIHGIKSALKCRYLLAGNFYSSVGDVKYTNTFSNKIVSGSVTVRLIDCDSGIVIWAKHIQDSYQATEYYSTSGSLQYNYYTEGQMMQQLISRLGKDIAEYFYFDE